jgi:hypothetical protein
MRRLLGGNDEPAQPDAPEFRVIRFELPERLLAAADPVVLRIESGGATHRLLSLEVEDALDFLVPTALLGDDASLVIEAGDEELPAPRHSDSPVPARDVYLALHEELDAQSRRVERLRRDLRAERARETETEADAPSMDPAIAQMRAELERERSARERAEERAEALDRDLDAVDERRAALASELAELQAALREERAEGD